MQKWLLHCHLVACCQTNQSFVCWRPWWISRKRIAPFNKPEQPFEAQKLLDKKTLQDHVAVALFIERFIKFSRNIHLNVYAGLRTQRDALFFKGTVFILELSNLPRARLLCDHWEIWVNCDSRHSVTISNCGHFQNTNVSRDHRRLNMYCSTDLRSSTLWPLANAL